MLDKGAVSKCLILTDGIFGMAVKKKGRNQIVQTLETTFRQPAKMLSLAFIRQRPISYILKSLTYSIVYYF